MAETIDLRDTAPGVEIILPEEFQYADEADEEQEVSTQAASKLSTAVQWFFIVLAACLFAYVVRIYAPVVVAKANEIKSSGTSGSIVPSGALDFLDQQIPEFGNNDPLTEYGVVAPQTNPVVPVTRGYEGDLGSIKVLAPVTGILAETLGVEAENDWKTYGLTKESALKLLEDAFVEDVKRAPTNTEKSVLAFFLRRADPSIIGSSATSLNTVYAESIKYMAGVKQAVDKWNNELTVTRAIPPKSYEEALAVELSVSAGSGPQNSADYWAVPAPRKEETERVVAATSKYKPVLYNVNKFLNKSHKDLVCAVSSTCAGVIPTTNFRGTVGQTCAPGAVWQQWCYYHFVAVGQRLPEGATVYVPSAERWNAAKKAVTARTGNQSPELTDVYNQAVYIESVETSEKASGMDLADAYGCEIIYGPAPGQMKVECP